MSIDDVTLNRDFSPYKIIGKQVENEKLFNHVESSEANSDQSQIKLVAGQSLTFHSDIIDAPREFWDLFNLIDFNFQRKKKRVLRHLHLLAPLD